MNPGTSPDESEWVSVGTFQRVIEADIAKGALDAFGIECYLSDSGNHVFTGLGYEWRGQPLSLSLVVKREDAERAREVLADNEGPSSDAAR